MCLNKDKCSFSKTEVMFYSHVFSAEGIKPDPKKVEAINSATPPENASEVKSLLGMTHYVSRYIPEYASHNMPAVRFDQTRHIMEVGTRGTRGTKSP